MRETSHVITCDPLSLTNGDRAGDKHEPWCAVQENQLYQAQMKGTSSAERKILGMPFMQADSAQRTNRCNPLIAELLRRIHMVEAWGRGMPLILRNAPDVEFREVAGIFITGFDRPSSTEVKGAAIEETIKEKTGTIDKTIDKEVTSTERAILDLIASNPAVTQKEMAARLNLSEIGIKYNTDKLKAKSFLRRTGGKKAGRWEILRDE
jgi:predicted HTH transcriptional regulator